MMTTVAAATTTTTTTATTTTTTTTVVSAVTVEQAVALGAVATVLLVGFLILKELLLAYAAEPRSQGSWKARAASFYAANLNIAILPLMFIFALIIVTKVASVL